MNPFIQQMINHKINTLTPHQLYQLAQQYHMPISMNQAQQITAILHEEPIDIQNEAQRKRILNQIAQVDPAMAQKIQTMLQGYM